MEVEGTQKPLSFRPINIKKLSVVCSNVKFPTLFPAIIRSTTPIKIPSRKYSKEQKKFIEKEIEQLPKDDIIEESFSPWRSKVEKEKGKWRLCVDYLQSVNRYADLDGFRYQELMT